MFGVVVLTSKGWRVCQTPKYGQILSGVGCGNLNKCEGIAGHKVSNLVYFQKNVASVFIIFLETWLLLVILDFL